MRFAPAQAPHVRPATSVTRVMGEVLLALVPAAVAWTWFFGPGLVVNIVVASAVALACEAAMLAIRGRPVRRHLEDLSALVTAVLLAFALPPLTPWWVTATGALFAIVFAKQLYGGLGYNPFNPAMAGYVVLLISFPVDMTRWLPPAGMDLAQLRPGLLDTLAYVATGALPGGLTWDAIGGATPLDDLRTQVGLMRTVPEIKAGPLYGDFGARGWEWVGNFVAIGGFWLLWRKIIQWHIPAAFLAGLILPATFFYLLDPGTHASPAFHVFSGAALLGAFFIATDPVSAAASPRGRLVYGFAIGLLVYVIRSWGGYPDGVAFAVLLLNMAVPAIDRYTVPRTYGHGR